MNSFFTENIIRWYHQNKRDLPWRHTTDAYTVWLSEIILQQTRVAQGLPYYQKFVEQFPTINHLASASEDEVLRVWQGLGYYSRARNLHKCAKYVVENYGGEFPKSFKELNYLPGIGPYTASAISSFCFGERVAVLDGNVFRLLARYFGIDRDISSSKTKKYFTEFANEILPEKNIDHYNQGIMEFGALQCKPKSPKCDSCPLLTGCYAFKHSSQSMLPVKTKKSIPQTIQFNYYVLFKNGKIWMRKREKSIWKGLFEFHLVEAEGLDMGKNGNEISEETLNYRHILSHRIINAQFHVSDYSGGKGIPEFNISEGKFYSLEEIEDLPKPILIEKFIKENLG